MVQISASRPNSAEGSLLSYSVNNEPRVVLFPLVNSNMNHTKLPQTTMTAAATTTTFPMSDNGKDIEDLKRRLAVIKKRRASQRSQYNRITEESSQRQSQYNSEMSPQRSQYSRELSPQPQEQRHLLTRNRLVQEKCADSYFERGNITLTASSSVFDALESSSASEATIEEQQQEEEEIIQPQETREISKETCETDDSSSSKHTSETDPTASPTWHPRRLLCSTNKKDSRHAVIRRSKSSDMPHDRSLLSFSQSKRRYRARSGSISSHDDEEESVTDRLDQLVCLGTNNPPRSPLSGKQQPNITAKYSNLLADDNAGCYDHYEGIPRGQAYSEIGSDTTDSGEYVRRGRGSCLLPRKHTPWYVRPVLSEVLPDAGEHIMDIVIFKTSKE